MMSVYERGWVVSETVSITLFSLIECMSQERR